MRNALPTVFYCNIQRRWTGQVVTFKAHGKGEYRYHSGAFWRGECKAGKRQVRCMAGVCVCVHRHRFAFTRHYPPPPVRSTSIDMSRDMQGLGDFINDDGSKIEGFWRENMLNGKITIKFSDGSVLKSVNYNDDKAMAEHVFADGRQ